MAPGTEKESHPQPPPSDFPGESSHFEHTPRSRTPPTTPTQPPLSGSDPKGTVPCGAISMPKARNTTEPGAPPTRATGPPAVATPLPVPVPLPPPPTTGTGNTRPTRKRDQCRVHHPRYGYRHRSYSHHHCYRPTDPPASACSGCHQSRPPQGHGPPRASPVAGTSLPHPSRRGDAANDAAKGKGRDPAACGRTGRSPGPRAPKGPKGR